jgi:hypothetical protein
VLPQPRNVFEHDWFYGLFVDPRFPSDDTDRVLIDFPDNSQLCLRGRTQLRLHNAQGDLVRAVNLPQPLATKRWVHIALSVRAAQGDTGYLRLFVDGYPLDEWAGQYGVSGLQRGNFRPLPGQLSLGHENGLRGIELLPGLTPFQQAAPFRGWMDEFKVFAYTPNLEVVCNLAHGTMVGLPDGYVGELSAQANRYAASAHALSSSELAARGRAGFKRYACYQDNTRDNGAHAFNVPPGVAPLREAFNFPEGPLYHDAPRPDSTANSFCVSCHYDKSPVPGLRLSALRLAPSLPAKLDPRRQPTQPPPRVYGNVPPRWFAGAPAVGFAAQPDGYPVDEWTMPSGASVAPEIQNLALADSRGQPIRALAPVTTLRPSEAWQIADSLRINTNGLTRRVAITINGNRIEDASVPFTVDTAVLRHGDNAIEVQAWNGDGQRVARSFTLRVEDWTRSGSVGGTSGFAFDDAEHVSGAPDVRAVILSGGDWLDQVGMEYADGTRLTHGGAGGGEVRLDLRAGEHVRSVRVCRRSFNLWEPQRLTADAVVSHVQVVTDQGRSIRRGVVTSECATYEAPPGQHIVGWHGRAGLYVNRLGVLYGH